MQELELVAPLEILSRWEENLVPNVMVHGDFNHTNIMVGGKRVYFIDWTDAGAGDEFADISKHANYFPLSSHDKLLHYYFEQPDAVLRRKLLCYYSLCMFLVSAWGIEQAKILSKDSDRLLPNTMKQVDLPEPCQILSDITTNKITSSRAEDFILRSAVALHCLSQLVKTDEFLSAIEEIKPHA